MEKKEFDLTWSPVIAFSLCTALSDRSKLFPVSADSELALLMLRAYTEVLDRPRKMVLDKLSILDWRSFPTDELCFVSENS